MFTGRAAERAERIVEKFYRGDDRLTAEKSGAGLGLSIARQLARGMGGGEKGKREAVQRRFFLRVNSCPSQAIRCAHRRD